MALSRAVRTPGRPASSLEGREGLSSCYSSGHRHRAEIATRFATELLSTRGQARVYGAVFGLLWLVLCLSSLIALLL